MELCCAQLVYLEVWVELRCDLRPDDEIGWLHAKAADIMVSDQTIAGDFIEGQIYQMLNDPYAHIEGWYVVSALYHRGGSDNPYEPLFVCASKEDTSGGVILKVINAFSVDQTITLRLTGANILKNVTDKVMVGELNTINIVDDPFHVISKDLTIDDVSSLWNHTLPLILSRSFVLNQVARGLAFEL
jgi:hypothetical protein